jgi:AraC-like DNA-binding protein
VIRMSGAVAMRTLYLPAGLERLAAGGAVTATAYDAGYARVSAFVAAFKRTFESTPGRHFDAGADGARAPPRRRAAPRTRRRRPPARPLRGHAAPLR